MTAFARIFRTPWDNRLMTQRSNGRRIRFVA